MAPNFWEPVQKEIARLLEAGLIFPVDNSSWCAPIVVSVKKNGKIRICVDFKQLNKATIKDFYPLPFIDQILDFLAGKECYSFMDCFVGYNQIALAPEDKLKTTFTTIFGTFAWHVMPFGLCNAPATYQRFMHETFKDMETQSLRIYLDDLGAATDSTKHVEALRAGLEKCREKSVALNPDKCLFVVPYGLLLGHLISGRGIQMDPAKVALLLALKAPTSRKELQSVLGSIGYYRRFLKDYAKISLPMTRLLRQTLPLFGEKNRIKALTK